MWASRVVLAMGVVAVSSCLPHLPFAGLSTGSREFHLATDVVVHHLDNGMVVALMPDARTNLVSVDVRYLVGRADDPAGRAGMAHLVEHLLFDARPVDGGPTLGDALGETTLWANAWTTDDYTHYAEVALADRLDEVIALEAQRLATTCDHLDDATFLRERDVVLEELARRRDFGFDGPKIAQAVWGVDHPYAVNRMDEIADATRDEACAFLRGHYGPNRAIVVVVGAFDPVTALETIVDRFGPLTGRAIEPRTALPLPPLQADRVEIEEGDKSGILVTFAAPPESDDEVTSRLAVVAMKQALGWMRKYERGIGRVDVEMIGAQRQRLFVVSVAAKEGRYDRAEELVFAAAAHVRRYGAVEAIKTWRAKWRTQTATRIDELWGRGDWLADYLDNGESGQLFLDTFAAIDAGSPDLVSTLANQYLVADRSRVVVIRAAEGGSTAEPPRATSAIRHADPVWRATVDPAEATVALTTPASAPYRELIDETLGNGLRIVLAPDPTSVIVDARLVLPVGGDGLARDAAYLLGDDLAPDVDKDDLQVLDWAMGLGTELHAGVREAATIFGARGLAVFADWHVWRLHYRWHRGKYPKRGGARDDSKDDELRELLAYFDSRPDDVLFARLFGADHPYATWNAKGFTNDELQAFRSAHYVVNGATLIVSGGFDVAPMRDEIVRLFGALPDDEPAERPAPLAITSADGPAWVQVIDEHATQVTFAIGFAPIDPLDDRPAHAASAILTEMVSERLALVRWRDGATYGLGTYVTGGEAGRALIIGGDVDPSRASAALQTVLDDLAALRNGADVAEDFVRARRAVLARAIASGGGASAVAGRLEAAVIGTGALDYKDEYAEAVAQTTVDDVIARAAHDLAPERRVVVIGGALEVIGPTLETAGATEIETITRPARPW